MYLEKEVVYTAVVLIFFNTVLQISILNSIRNGIRNINSKLDRIKDSLSGETNMED